MSGTCQDKNLNDLMAVVAAGNFLSNPQAAITASCATAVYARAAAVTTYIGIHGDPGGHLAALLTGFTNFAGTSGGGLSTSSLGCFKAHTDFISGATQAFPASTLAAITGGIAGAAVITSMTYRNMLGATNSGLNTTSALCNLDPANPCALISGVIGSVVGAISAAMSAMVTAINAMTDFAGSAVAYLAQITGFISTIVNQITSELTNLVSLALAGINFALAKLLKALNINPCFQPLIAAAGSTALLAALAE